MLLFIIISVILIIIVVALNCRIQELQKQIYDLKNYQRQNNPNQEDLLVLTKYVKKLENRIKKLQQQENSNQYKINNLIKMIKSGGYY